MAQHSPSSSSTEACPKGESRNGLPETKTSPTVSRQLIMIFGDHEDDNDNTTNITDRFSRTSMRRNKKGASAASDLIFGEIKIIKKRRYRTIQSLYMVTKPID